MNKILILLSLPFLFTFSLKAQNDSITVNKKFGGYSFQQSGQYVTPKTMLTIMKDDPEALQYMKKAKTNYDVSMVVGATGGFLIGYPVGTAIAGGDPNWLMAGIGAGILLIAIPTTKAANTNALKAIEIYNSSLSTSYFQNGINIDFGFTASGLGLKLIF